MNKILTYIAIFYFAVSAEYASPQSVQPPPTDPNKLGKLLNHSQDRTSTDLYCETMTIAFFESALEGKPPSSKEHAKRLEAAEQEMLETCKSMPIRGGKVKIEKEMTAIERAQISCLAIANGIATAQASKTEDNLLYSKLSQQQQFFSKACSSNRKQFLSDMKKYGPYHVLSKNY